MEYKVLIAAGHGGSDPGAVVGKFIEKTLALAVASACVKELNSYPGVTAYQARKKDVSQSIDAKVKMANDLGVDFALDIHFNIGKGKGKGAEVWCSYLLGVGKILAENILKRFEEIGQNSRGVKTKKNDSGQDYFGFIRMTKMPAAIVECGFLDNAADMKLFDTPAELKKTGVAIAKGVLDTITQENNKNRSEAKSEPKKGYAKPYPVLPGVGYFVKGASGLQVKRLQKFLNWCIDAGLEEDGILGDATVAAVKKFQRLYGLEVDGLFGKKCLEKAKKILK